MRLRKHLISCAAAICLLFGAQSSFAQEEQMPAQVQENVKIPFEEFTLENGLRVFLLKDNSLPIISVNLWFNVGSKDEQEGRTGFAHLFEHLMFMGTDKVPNIDLLLESGGGSNNASTREDVTNYYTVAPENMLEMVLFIESDRFAHLADAMTQEKLDKQRDVVLNERRQTLENQPYGKLWLEMPTALYPADHPYAHPVIGSSEDIRAAKLEDVIAFFNTYYVPANATLVVGGDFDSARARSLVEKYFGAIPKRPEPQHRAVPQITKAVKTRLTIEDEVQVPRLTMVFHSPAVMAPGDAELDIFANVLCKGQNSRLVNRLVYEKQLASNVSCGQMSGLASLFLIDAMPLPGVSIETLEAEIMDEIKKIVADGVTEKEFNQTKNGIETAFVMQLQSIGSRADSFNSYVFYSNGQTNFPEGDLNRYRNATIESMMATVRTLFSDDSRRSTLIVVPKETSAPKDTNAQETETNTGAEP